jgi:hypothetical protein
MPHNTRTVNRELRGSFLVGAEHCSARGGSSPPAGGLLPYDNIMQMRDGVGC